MEVFRETRRKEGSGRDVMLLTWITVQKNLMCGIKHDNNNNIDDDDDDDDDNNLKKACYLR